MINLLAFSIPLSTPQSTTAAVAPKNIIIKKIGAYCDVIKLLKKLSCAALCALAVANTVKYLTTHPPITQ